MVARTQKQLALDALLREHGPYSVREFKAAQLRVTLDNFGWNRTRTAEHLGIDRSTLYRRMVDLGVVPGAPECCNSRKDS